MTLSKLQLIQLDVCGSLHFSNLVTYISSLVLCMHTIHYVVCHIGDLESEVCHGDDGWCTLRYDTYMYHWVLSNASPHLSCNYCNKSL